MARQFGNYSPSVPLGITWEEELTVVDPDGVAVNLTGYTGRMHLRLNVADAAPAMELTAAGSRLVITDAVNGVIRITVSAADTTALVPSNEKTKFYYDLELRNESVSPVYVIPVVKGKVTFNPRVTR